MEIKLTQPETPRITDLYRHFDKNGDLLYVGISLNAVNRTTQHKAASHWFHEIAEIKIEKHESREEALRAEWSAIYKENPKYNLHRPVDEPLNNHAQRSKDDIIKRMVDFKPIYSLQEAASVLTLPYIVVKRLISTGDIGKVCTGERKYKGVAKPTYKITGWQIIEFIERLESGEKLKEMEGKVS